MNNSKIGVLGAGTMGEGIAQVAAQAGHRVVLVDVNEAALTKAQANFQSIFARLVEKGKMTNEKLVEVIESKNNGAVISELLMSTPSHPAFFPRRNRIISGMSLGTLIIESDRNGGAMITATTAIDQNRELFALPGNISEKKSYGTNTLIKSGQAKLVQSVDDILDELAVPLQAVITSKPHKVEPPTLNVFEQKIYDVMTLDPLHIDVISEQSGLTTSDVLVNLLSLEFKGIVLQMAGKMFRRV